MVAMDSIIESYGGRKKIDGLKALWNAGVLTSQINPDLLKDYLIGTEEEGRNSGDIGNTELIYLGQLKEADILGMRTAIEVRMDGLLGTTEMEYRGLPIDLAVAKEDMAALMAEQKEVAARLDEYIKEHVPEEVNFSWTSGTHVSCLLFGGTIKYEKRDVYIDEATGELARYKAKERWPLFNGKAISLQRLQASEHACYDEMLSRWSIKKPDGSELVQDVFKSGKKVGEGKFTNVDVEGELKIKWQDYFYKLPGITEPDPDWKGSLTDGAGGPVYSTDKDTVEVLGTRDIPFLKDFSRNAKLNKELGTYYARYDPKKKEYVGMLTTVDETGVVHHSLNHVNTVTSRLSSNNPNMQNLPRADKSRVKRMFISRFKEAYCKAHGIPCRIDADGNFIMGQMVEIDYSQLEVVVQGLLSNDTNLVKDLINQVDFHCKRVALKHQIKYEDAIYWCKDETYAEYKKWKAERTKAKNFSFQRAYGAGAAAIAASTGMDIEEVKAMIAAEEEEYSGVKRYNDMVEREVNATAEPFRDGERGWRVFRRGTYTAPTGTIYSFRTYDALKWQRDKGITDSFMPTELKNYPIQGTGGEIVQMVLGVMFRLFMRKNNWDNRAFLVNTVHDCYWIDTHPDVTREVADAVLKVMNAVPQLLKKFYNIECPVPFPAEAEYGPNMYDLTHFH
jgi:hypothetical protein